MASTINASTTSMSGLVYNADASGVLQLQSNGTTGLTVGNGGNVTISTNLFVSGKEVEPLVLDTAQNASGTSVEFTGIPSWVKKITVMFSGLSMSGTSFPIIQLGTAPATYKTTGYLGTATTGAGTSTNMSTGFIISSATAAADIGHGMATLTTINGLIWTYSSLIGYSNQAATRYAAGSATSSSIIDRIRITTVNGTDTFDAGTVNIMYE